MGRIFLHYINDELGDDKKPKARDKLVVYMCRYCKTHLSEASQLVSKVRGHSDDDLY